MSPPKLHVEALDAVAALQRRLRRGARLEPLRLDPLRGALTLGLEWSPEPTPPTDTPFSRATQAHWRREGRLAAGRRGLYLTLAAVLAELAMASGAGLALWDGEALSAQGPPGARTGGGPAGRSGSIPR